MFGENKMDFISKIIELFSTQSYMQKLFKGLMVTLEISVLASILGLCLGVIVALVSLSGKSKLTVIPKAICNLYITIIRGTPMALQLFIMFCIIFTFRGFPGEITATIAFGVNSGAYVAENIRAGILSVDIGQTEAGRALGLSKATTMMRIVIPQAIKNVIPTIGNELIALIKETSIINMVGMYDLTMAAKDIGAGSNMASYVVPMTVAALFYLAIVYALTFVIKTIERRLRTSDKR
jgi:His/Glu/Gln/Arg/opine family amino acid ABC transporter permease subunit